MIVMRRGLGPLAGHHNKLLQSINASVHGLLAQHKGGAAMAAVVTARLPLTHDRSPSPVLCGAFNHDLLCECIYRVE